MCRQVTSLVADALSASQPSASSETCASLPLPVHLLTMVTAGLQLLLLLLLRWKMPALLLLVQCNGAAPAGTQHVARSWSNVTAQQEEWCLMLCCSIDSCTTGCTCAAHLDHDSVALLHIPQQQIHELIKAKQGPCGQSG